MIYFKKIALKSLGHLVGTMVSKKARVSTGNLVRFSVFSSHKLLSGFLCGEVAKRVNEKPNLVMSLPTGNTPIIMYQFLVDMYRSGKVSFSEARFFMLDEFVGLAQDDPHSFAYYLHEHLFRHTNFREDNLFLLDGLAPDPDGHEERLKHAGGLDLIGLGIGLDGHLGYLLPGIPPTSRTMIDDLAPYILESIRQHRPDVTRSITMGIATILEANEVFLMANGVAKAQIIADAFAGPVTNRIPASHLQHHPNLTVFLDREAASLLTFE